MWVQFSVVKAATRIVFSNKAGSIIFAANSLAAFRFVSIMQCSSSANLVRSLDLGNVNVAASSDTNLAPDAQVRNHTTNFTPLETDG